MDTYQSPLVTRNASPIMSVIWGQEHKFKLWRRLWCELAKAQHELGLPISKEQVDALFGALKEPIDMVAAAKYEQEMHHDVMAHIKTFGDHVPIAKGIIHLGATSQFVVDNADSIRIRSSLGVVVQKLSDLIIKIGDFADKYKTVATLGLTHFQPAQPTTVGRRAVLWANDLYLVLFQLGHNYHQLQMRGVKGATGTQASFLELFDGDHDKVCQLDAAISNAFKFDSYMITGQTYPRISDAIITSSLAAAGAVCQKIATDIRLLAGKKEIMEGFSSKQVGSSAMPYKRNPLYCERVCGLAKFLIGLVGPSMTVAAEQWLERSLDDSSARRILLPESYLATDGILGTMHKIFDNLVINEVAIAANLSNEAALLATEKLLMAAVKNGADRQELHEKIKQCSLKYNGDELIQQLALLPEVNGLDLLAECQTDILVGRAVEQVDWFIENVITPLRVPQTESAHSDG